MKRINELEKRYVLEVLENEFRTSKNSVFNSRLEQKFAQTFGVEYAIAQVNGTTTLHTALAALGIKPEDEVIVPPLTMSSPALSVLQNLSIPVFADVDKETFNIDPESVKDCITEKTKAIISVAVYGLSPDYDNLMEICRKHNLYLIEDNAECFLGEYKGKLVGSFGHFASYSFQASKHMTCGEGGMLTTDDETLANNARKFSSLGYATVDARKGKITKKDIQDPQFDRHIILGFNYRMSELTAAAALGQLERLSELVENRIRVAKLFDEAIAGVDYIQRQAEPAGYKNAYWSYSVILKTEKPETEWYRFRDLFKKNGGDGFYAAWKLSYMERLFLNNVQKRKGIRQEYKNGLCPNAEYLQPRMIQFKTNYWDLAEAEYQAEILRKTVKEYSPLS